MIRKRLNVHHFLPGFCLAFTLFVFAPADLYLSSAGEFWFSLTDMVRWLAVFAAAGFFLVTFLAVILPPKFSAAFRAAVYACSFLAWLQGNVLVQDYGTLDGRQIDWPAYTVPCILDAALWIAVTVLFIFLMLRFRKKFRRILEIAACVLLITQAISVGVFLIRYQRKEKEEYLYLSHEGEFTVSPERNVIVFIPDTVDSTFFDEFIGQYPDVAGEAFADFTFYRDTVAGAARTKYAIPYILTGDVDRQERKYSDYLKESFAASPLLDELAAGNYDSGFYTYEKFMDLTRSDAIHNVVVGSRHPTSDYGLTRKFMKLVAFRYAPSALARYFWMYTGDFDIYKNSTFYTPNDEKYYRNLKKKGLEASAEKPAFRFIHLRGLHPPIRLDENLKQVSASETDETKQTLGLVKLFSRYFKELKKLGVYDDATIIIMADHGSYNHNSKGQAPLFMVKFAGSSHPFETSDLPLSYAAVPKILISALRGELTSLEPWKAEGPRYFYQRSEDSTVVNLTEYVINGPVNSTRPEATGVVYHEGTLESSRDYTPGIVLYFDTRETARPYFVSGMANNEGAAIWTSDYDTEFLFRLPETPGDLELKLRYADTYNGSQTVEVWVNDRLLDTANVNGPSHQTVPVPAGTVTGKEIRLRLHFPDAVSPAELGLSSNRHPRAVSMHSLVFDIPGNED